MSYRNAKSFRTMLKNTSRDVFERAKNRGSYMNAHVLLNLLNKLGEKDKMQGL